MATGKANPDPQEVVDNAVVTPQRSASEYKEKGVMAVTCPLPDEPEKPGEFPLSWKITALVCGLMLSWGSSFSENTLGPLKKTLIRELDITNAQYGAISSATALVNSILPILGGYGLNHYGVKWGSLVCSVAIFLGAGELGAPVGRKPAKPFTFVGTVLLCSMIIVSWVLFIRYSI